MQDPSLTDYDNTLTNSDDEPCDSQPAGACCLEVGVETKIDNEWMQLESSSANSLTEDDRNSTDSLSSSLSMSDSDLSSGDGDSFDLSESESITDVTPLNSPYCDSPLPYSTSLEQKSKDPSLTTSNPSSSMIDGNPQAEGSGEMNLIISAIKKLEVEENEKGIFESLSVLNKRKTVPSAASSDPRRIEQENQRLFKRIIQQHTRGKYCYSQSHYGHKLSVGNRYRQHKCEKDNIVMNKKSQSSSQDKDSSKRRGLQQSRFTSHTTYQAASGVSSSNTSSNDTLFCSKSPSIVTEANTADKSQGEVNMH